MDSVGHIAIHKRMHYEQRLLLLLGLHRIQFFKIRPEPDLVGFQKLKSGRNRILTGFGALAQMI